MFIRHGFCKCHPQVRPLSRAFGSSKIGAFRKNAEIEGITIVADKKSAKRALAELWRLRDRPHAWDTETVGINLRGSGSQSPVTHGSVVCATCFCGDDADFGSGPRLFIDNDGPASGMLLKEFKDYFENGDVNKVFHNYSFDAHMLKRTGVKVHGFHADTLHLARLYDTSLSAWEGNLAKQRIKERVKSSRVETPRQSTPSAAQRVIGVSLGGKPLASAIPRGARAGSGAALPAYIEEFAESPLLGEIDGVVAPNGYGLKNLAAYFGLGEGKVDVFADLFGADAYASESAHNSPEEFPRFADYATKDAMLTFRLFSMLQAKLKVAPWLSQVHMRPMDKLLRDKDIAKKLYQKGECPEQFDTGKSMWDFYETYMREFGENLMKLERVGVEVDIAALRRMEQAAVQDIKICEQDFVDAVASHSSCGASNPHAALINTRSSKQLQTVLFGGVGINRFTEEALPAARDFPLPCGDASEQFLPDERPPGGRFVLQSMGLEPVQKRCNFTESGWPSVSSSTLRELAGSVENPGLAYAQLLANGATEAEAVRMTQGLRQLGAANRLKSLMTGFLQPLQRHGELAGRIHPSWAYDTSTGRLACRRPNLQNLPTEHQKRYRLRDAFKAKPGNALVVADYSQLEMKVLAHMSDSKLMIEKLSKGGDYHSEVAAEMFQHVAEAVKSGEVALDSTSANGRPTVKDRFPVERSQAKAVNFGIVYGKEATSIAEDMGISKIEAEQLYENWYKAKPEVRKWKDRVVKQSRKDKHMVSMLGRRRNLPFLDDEVPAWRRRSERACVNFGIQGSAADIVIASMLRVNRSKRLEQINFELVMQVHDEFVLEGPEEYAVEASDLIREYMTDPFREHNAEFQMKLPLTVDVGIGPSLYSAKA